MKTDRTMSAVATASILFVVGCSSATGGATSSLPPATAAPTDRVAVASPSLKRSPSEEPTEAATPAPQTTPVQVLTRRSGTFEPSVTLDAPSDWRIADDSHEAFVVVSSGSVGTMALQANPIIGSDENGCEGLAAPGGATTANGIVAALSSSPKLVVSDPHAVQIGELTGQAIDIDLDPAWTGECNWSGGQRATLILTTQDPPGPFNGIIDTERWRLLLVDVGHDVVAIIVSAPDASTFDAYAAQAMPVVESLRFSQASPSG